MILTCRTENRCVSEVWGRRTETDSPVSHIRLRDQAAHLPLLGPSGLISEMRTPGCTGGCWLCEGKVQRERLYKTSRNMDTRYWWVIPSEEKLHHWRAQVTFGTQWHVGKASRGSLVARVSRSIITGFPFLPPSGPDLSPDLYGQEYQPKGHTPSDLTAWVLPFLCSSFSVW